MKLRCHAIIAQLLRLLVAGGQRPGPRIRAERRPSMSDQSGLRGRPKLPELHPARAGPGDAVRGRHERHHGPQRDRPVVVLADRQQVQAGAQDGAQAAARLRRVQRVQLQPPGQRHQGGRPPMW